MKIHREGYKIVIIGFLILLIINVLTVAFVDGAVLVKWMVGGLSLVCFLFFVSFFRIPDRKIKPVKGLVFAPADGKIVVIEETEEKEYFKDLRLQVSIFMSPFDMHSNKYPVSGKIKYINYHPGNKMVAWNPKSSQLNERSSVVIELSNGIEIMVRQIAGAFARRIVTYAETGNEAVQGDELGFIKFGSRVDLFLPAGTELKVDMFDKVKANKTVIARINM